jgi:hypothetical protein
MPSGMPSTSRQTRSTCEYPAIVEDEARGNLFGSLDEQAHRRSAAVFVLRETESLDVEHPLALDVEPLTRRRQELDVWGALDDVA